jgi:hypothetical protein
MRDEQYRCRDSAITFEVSIQSKRKLTKVLGVVAELLVTFLKVLEN